VAVGVITIIGGATVCVLDFKTVVEVFSLLTSLLPQAGRMKVLDNNRNKSKFLVKVFKSVLQNLIVLLGRYFSGLPQSCEEKWHSLNEE